MCHLSLLALDSTNHQALPCRFHDLPRHLRQGIDFHQAGDLRQQAMQQTVTGRATLSGETTDREENLRDNGDLQADPLRLCASGAGISVMGAPRSMMVE
jgi:hypothetical protein